MAEAEAKANGLIAMPDFPYPELPTADALRLLTLKPANQFLDELEGTLVSIPFSSKPRYIALSHTSTERYSHDGDKSPSRAEDSRNGDRKGAVIHLNGHELPIGANVTLALRFFRSTKAPVPLWIDAICVDQNSPIERNRPVSLTAFIYSRAVAAVSWLGAPSIRPHEAPDDIDLMREWQDGNTQNVGPELAKAVTSRSKRGERTRPFSWEWIKQRSIELEHHKSHISASSYWSRLWAVQEVCLPRHLAFMCGGAIWTESVIWDAAKAMELLSLDVTAESSLAEMRRLQISREGRFGDAMRLEALIERFADGWCQDIRDRVFGLVGLANNVNVVARAAGLTKPPQLEDSSLSQDHSGSRVGSIEIDYKRSFYDIWRDVVHLVYTNSTTPLGTGPTREDQGREGGTRLVRFSGVVQRAFEGNVEREVKMARPSAGSSDTPPVTAMGYVAGSILTLGPRYSQFISSYRAQKKWAYSLRRHYSSSRDLETLRRMQESYEEKILYYSVEDLDRIRALDSSKSAVWSVLQGNGRAPFGDVTHDLDAEGLRRPTDPSAADPVLFLGTDHCMGLAPSIAKPGDHVVRFYNCNAAILMRPTSTPSAEKPTSEVREISEQHGVPPGPEFLSSRSGRYQIVGRVDVAESGSRDEDRGDSRAMNLMSDVERSLPAFQSADASGLSEWSRGVFVCLDFQTLQQISAGIEIYGWIDC